MIKTIFSNYNSEELKSIIKQAIIEVANEETSRPQHRDEEVYFDQRQAAKFLNISLPTIISWKKAGKIPYYQVGKTVRFKKSELLDSIRKNESLLK